MTVGDIVHDGNTAYVVSQEWGNERQLIGPVSDRPMYIDIFDQVLRTPTRSNPSSGWDTIHSADYIDPETRDLELIKEAWEQLQSRASQGVSQTG